MRLLRWYFDSFPSKEALRALLADRVFLHGLITGLLIAGGVLLVRTLLS